jgi:predicted outer membrane repeat protein
MRKPSLRALAVISVAAVAVTSVAAVAVAVGAGALVAAQTAVSGCEATYSVGAQWKGGFIGNVAVRNDGDSVSYWRLTWTFSGGQRLVQAWGASAAQSGTQVNATSVTWNATLGKGSSVRVGFVGTGSGKNSTPTAVTLNGVTCTGSEAPVSPSPLPTTAAPSPLPTPTPTPSPSPSPSPSPPPTTSPSPSPGGSSGGSDGPVAAADCTEPAPLPVPVKKSVVGRGTTATCTEDALRSAVAAGGNVTFDCGGESVTIPVTKEITTKGTTVIDGGGKVTLDGGGGNRVLVVGQDATLSVRNLKFVNGKATQEGEQELSGGGAIVGFFRSQLEVIGSTFEKNTAGMGGGAIMIGTEGKLSILRSVFKGNTSAYGGAVYSLLAPLTVMNSTFTDNSTVKQGGGGEGGAIGTDGGAPPNKDSKGGDIRLCGSTLTRNSAHNGGGGAFLWGYARDRIIIDRTTFKDNKVDGLGGGARVSLGRMDYSSTGTISISASSVMSNTSTGNGGGLYVDCLSTCDIENSTFYGNSSKTYGGAIFGDGHHDNNVTFAKNSAGGHGGALFGSKFVLNNTIFVDNSAGNPWNQAMSCSSAGSGTHVLQWLSSGADQVSQCISGVTAADPQLQPPADNGGPTLTMMPSPDSPVLKAGSGCTSRDQRGVARPSGTCDLGAVQRS